MATALAALLEERRAWKAAGRVVVFTNGCFDLLHPGHVALFEAARSQGDLLVVGLNSDRSVRALKGEGRPLVTETERAETIGPSRCRPRGGLRRGHARTITALARASGWGADWALDAIVGREEVEAGGGRVVRRAVARAIDDVDGVRIRHVSAPSAPRSPPGGRGLGQ